jgi:tetratricopeptide (TPR) repeat protein
MTNWTRRRTRALGALLLALGISSALPAQEPVAESRIGFSASLGPDTVYVGEQATYTLTVSIPTAIRQRLRRNPEFVPPEPRAMLAYDLPLARTAAPEQEIEIHTFRRALFALTPGRYSIAPARLTYAMPQSASFFSREEERTLRSEGTSFVAIDPPTRGRPEGWLGAVGQWRVTSRLDAARARVGDPLVLTLRVEGTGNASLLPRPTVSIPWADVVVSDARVIVDSTPVQLGGIKEFRWLVTPRDDGARTVPPIAYVYFDPRARRYETARSAPIPVAVAAGTRVALPDAVAGPRPRAPLEIRTTLAGSRAAPDQAARWLLLLALLAPLPWLVRFVRVARAAARARVDTPELALSARAAFDAAIRARTGLPIEQLTAAGALAQALRLEGVTAEAAQEAEALRDAFDTASFAPKGNGRGDASLAARSRALIERISSEARKVAVLLAVGLLVGGCVGASESEETLRAFADGRTSYAGGEYVRARDAFKRATELAPRDPATWANFGDASWQANDTASAVLGWQRALRLDPTDKSVRERLTLVRAPQLGGIARVWPVSTVVLGGAAVVLWVAAWILLWAHVRSGPGIGLLIARIAMGGAVVTTLLALAADSRLAARDLGVVAVAQSLLALPALGADPGPVPLVGEIARVVEHRGVWVRIELSGERSGWYPAERVLPLARD